MRGKSSAAVFVNEFHGDAAASFPGAFAVPPFDQILPRRTRRREGQVEPVLACQSALHAGLCVGGIVVDDQMQRAFRWRFAVHLSQEAEACFVTMALEAPPLTVPCSTASAAKSVVESCVLVSRTG